MSFKALGPLRLAFLALAIWGAVHPMSYFLPWLATNGWSFVALSDAWFANDAVAGLTWDLTIAAIALSLWAAADAVQTRRWRLLWTIPATFCIGVSCGLPLFAFLRLGLRRA